MFACIIDITLLHGLGSVKFKVRRWEITDGCLFCFGEELDTSCMYLVKSKEVAVFPLSSILCFYERMES